TTDYYTFIADYLAEVLGNNRSIVYTNLVKDDAPLAIALKEKGINNSSYHGKNLSSHDKLKIIGNLCFDDSKIQASLMVCTSAL
uniref:Helicase C-terminal domain-containing protein n=1 Tax=Amphimedon queenslandica TaxID=400682 RepID=A0A1X7TSL0_AMPQE